MEYCKVLSAGGGQANSVCWRKDCANGEETTLEAVKSFSCVLCVVISLCRAGEHRIIQIRCQGHVKKLLREVERFDCDQLHLLCLAVLIFFRLSWLWYFPLFLTPPDPVVHTFFNVRRQWKKSMMNLVIGSGKISYCIFCEIWCDFFLDDVLLYCGFLYRICFSATLLSVRHKHTPIHKRESYNKAPLGEWTAWKETLIHASIKSPGQIDTADSKQV